MPFIIYVSYNKSVKTSFTVGILLKLQHLRCDEDIIALTSLVLYVVSNTPLKLYFLYYNTQILLKLFHSYNYIIYTNTIMYVCMYILTRVYNREGEYCTYSTTLRKVLELRRW